MLWSGFCVDGVAVPADLLIADGLIAAPELTVDALANDVGLVVFVGG